MEIKDDDLFIKSNLLNSKNDMWRDLNEKINIKDNNIYNDFLSLSDNELFLDNNINNNNNFQIEYEELNGQKIDSSLYKTDKKTLSNSKKETLNILNENENENEIKKKLKLKRNREASKDTRKRKKEFIHNLINEYNILKIKYQKLLNIVKECKNCKEKLNFFENNDNKSENENEYIYESKNNMLNKGHKFSNRKKILFTIAMTIMSIINIFNIPLNIMKYYKNIENDKLEYLRNLNSNNDYYQNYSKDNFNTLLLNKFNSSNGETEGLFIHFAEYYSLIEEAETYLNKEKHDIKNEVFKDIQIYKENELKSDQITKENAINCVKCIVEIDKKSIKMGGNEFTFYFADKSLSKLIENNIKEKMINSGKINNNYISFPKILTLKCKILGYSVNELFLGKID